jgi:hypothetical protein
MLRYELLPDEQLLIVSPDDSLTATDFEELARAVDPYIEEHGRLRGLMVYTKSFPGWDDFAGLIAHMKFVKNHHQYVERVAAVTDSNFLSVAPRIAKLFVQAEVKRFPFADKHAALAWLKSDKQASS